MVFFGGAGDNEPRETMSTKFEREKAGKLLFKIKIK